MKFCLIAFLFFLLAIGAPAPTTPAVNVHSLESITFRANERTVVHRTGETPRPRLTYQIVHPEASLYAPTLIDVTCFLAADGAWVCSSPQMPANLQFGTVSVNCDGPHRQTNPSDPNVWVDSCSLQYELLSIPKPNPRPRTVLLGSPAKPSSSIRLEPEKFALSAFRVFGDNAPMGLIFEAPRVGGTGKLIVHFVDTNDDLVVTGRKIGFGPIEIFSGAGVPIGTAQRQSSDPKAPYILNDGYGMPFAQSTISSRLLGLAREYIFTRLDDNRVIARLVPRSNGEWRVADVDPTSIDPRVASVIASMIKFRADIKDEL